MQERATGQQSDSDFKPAWWLRSPHLQTLWPSLLRPTTRLDVSWERLELADGDFIDLAWRRRPGPLVLLIHGLEGSLESHYAAPLLKLLEAEGYGAVFMHLRGCGREPNRLNRSYHSGASEDLAEVLERLELRGERPDALIGISLGGNLLLKYLGECGRAARTRAAIAISVPFRLQIAAIHMQQGFSRVYQRYLLHKLVRSYKRKFADRPVPLQVAIDRIGSIYEFDERITAPLNGFESAEDYYRRCSCIGFLKRIETPTLILHALDDPLMRPDVIPQSDELGPGVTLELCRHGGHVGFIEGRLPGRPQYWLERRIPHYLNQQLLS
ncbi:MAG: hydrolase [Candidatus Thiodiazotropha sp.]